MFGLFKRESEIYVLQKKDAETTKDWHKPPAIDRKASAKVYEETEAIAEKIDTLKIKNK